MVEFDRQVLTMESKPAQERPTRPSFAKVSQVACLFEPVSFQSSNCRYSSQVAAMRAPSKPQSSTTHHEQNAGTPAAPITSPPVSHSSTTTVPSQQSVDNVESGDIASGDNMGSLNNAVRELDITGLKDQAISESQPENREDAINKAESTFEDDQTHLSNSSTKPTSFDSKSVASVATFAMDEKESLRPDDSASVQAAEEDESLSGPVSSAPNSRMGSEASGRRLRHNYGDGPENLATSQRAPGILSSGPQFNGGLQIAGVTPPNPVPDNFTMANPDSFETESSLHGFPKEPDEKLLEAMNSPKDRLLLLQLEEKIVSFIKDSKYVHHYPPVSLLCPSFNVVFQGTITRTSSM